MECQQFMTFLRITDRESPQPNNSARVATSQTAQRSTQHHTTHTTSNHGRSLREGPRPPRRQAGDAHPHGARPNRPPREPLAPAPPRILVAAPMRSALRPCNPARPLAPAECAGIANLPPCPVRRSVWTPLARPPSSTSSSLARLSPRSPQSASTWRLSSACRPLAAPRCAPVPPRTAVYTPSSAAARPLRSANSFSSC